MIGSNNNNNKSKNNNNKCSNRGTITEMYELNAATHGVIEAMGKLTMIKLVFTNAV